MTKKYMPELLMKQRKYKTCELYYANQNDILRKQKETENSPLRNADNRISHNWHSILVNQKVSYLFTYPPTFQFKDNRISEKVSNVLGNSFASLCTDVATMASNLGSTWIHLYNFEDELKFTAISACEIVPIYSRNIHQTLDSIIRTYLLDDDDGEFRVFEYWDNFGVYAYRERGNIFEKYEMFGDGISYLKHNFTCVPFIEFKNNRNRSSDLDNIKSLIDVYDNIFSGFVNDIEDIQQVIFILTNYGGEDLNSFLSDLKRYKTVDMQKSDSTDQSGLSTLSIDIPVQARNDLLKITRKQIFTSGGGLDPENEHISNTSGVALKYLYSMLELKAGLMEAEFRKSFNTLIDFILNFLKIYTNPRAIQSFNRCAVQNDLEKASIISSLSEFTSLETISQNNPLVDDPQREIEYLKGEKNGMDKKSSEQI